MGQAIRSQGDLGDAILPGVVQGGGVAEKTAVCRGCFSRSQALPGNVALAGSA
jgi:hypothetical protein